VSDATDSDRPGSGRGPVLHLRDIARLAPAYVVPGLTSFLTVPILFAILSPPEYGRWALLYGIAAGVPQVTTSWLEQRLLRFGHRAGRQSDRRRTVAAIAISIVAGALLTTAFVPQATLLDVIAAAALTSLVSAYLLLIASLQAAMDFTAVSVAATTRSVLGAVLGVIGGALTGKAGVAILGLALGYLTGELVGRRAATRRQLPGAATSTEFVDAAARGEPVRTQTASAEAPPERATYGVASAAAAVASYVLSVGDRFLLAGLRPLADVGTYAATYMLIDLVGRFVPSIVIGTVRPRIFRAWDRGVRDDATANAVVLAAVFAWLVALIVSLLVIAAHVSGRLPVDPVLAGPIALGFACLMAASTLGVPYSAATRQGRLSGHLAIAAVLNVGLNAVLIPPLGPFGAAVTTGISYAVLLALNLAGLRSALRVTSATVVVTASSVLAIGLVIAAGTLIDSRLLGLAVAAAAAGAPFAYMSMMSLRRTA
jgi:O-antigen/teichoic acid export membrane protein